MVFYIIVPTHIISLASPALRQIISAVRKAKKDYAGLPILYHLLPEPFLSRSLDNPTMRHLGLETIADAVYDRILVVTRRILSRPLASEAPLRIQAEFQEPAFTLARPAPRRASYRLERHPSSLDVVDRLSILHVGYRLSPCGKWLLAASVDQRAEMHELKAWLMPSDDPEVFIVKNVYFFAQSIAARANLEWRIAIAKLGPLEELEIEGEDHNQQCS